MANSVENYVSPGPVHCEAINLTFNFWFLNNETKTN